MEWMNLKIYVFLVALVAYFTCEAQPQQKMKVESKFIPENRHGIENFRGNISTAVTTVKSDDVTTDLGNQVRHRKQSKQDFEWIGRKFRKETSILPYVVVQHSLTLRNFTLVKVPMLGFMTAQKHCEKNGGHLATVKAQQDVDTMRKLLALSSYENDRYIFEAYVGDGGRQTNIYGNNTENIPYGSPESEEPYAEELCTTLKKEGILNKVDCSWSLAFFCEAGREVLHL